jgi:hypothetical protein
MTCPKKPGRPVGDKRQALAQWVNAQGRFTMRQLVRGLGWSMRDADNHLRLALRRQELQVIGKVAQPGCKRKVALYAPAQVHVLGANALKLAIARWGA